MGDAKFVEVVQVGDAEVERGEEDDLRGGEVGEEVEGDDAGAPDEFFAYGALGLVGDGVSMVVMGVVVVLEIRRTTMKLRYPIQLLNVSRTPRRRIQSCQSPSTTAYSNNGPANRIATSSIVRAVSRGEMGHTPRRRRISEADADTLCLANTTTVMRQQTTVDKLTARVLARMDEGASRVRVLEGRVADER